MSGIAGFIDFSKSTSKEILLAMTDSLAHRGPDGSGTELFESGQALIGMGFRALATGRESSQASQPLKHEQTGCMIIHDGAIYNYKELKKELESLGRVFLTGSDAEIFLHAFLQWGRDCVQRIIGMFSTAVFDAIQNKMIYFRDRGGVKPFYYYWSNDLFLFASELKAFHQHPNFNKEIDFTSLSQFFQNGYVTAPHCIFKYCNKLLPGHILEMDLNTRATKNIRYWDVTHEYDLPPLSVNFEEATTATEKILASSALYCLGDNSSTGIFLDGGYDSACLAALLQKKSGQKVKTFTLAFKEEAFNYAPYAKEIADHLGTEHHELESTIHEVVDFIPQFPEIFDEPLGDTSAITTTLLCRKVREHATVALSADGSDEIFAGYPRYQRFLHNWNRNSMTLLRGAVPFKKDLLLFLYKTSGGERMKPFLKALRMSSARQPIDAYLTMNHYFFEEEAEDLLGTEIVVGSTGNISRASIKPEVIIPQILAHDYKTYLADDVLQKSDRASMSVGLEVREPFLDQRVIEYVSKLPLHYKFRKDESKIMLKKIVHRYVPEKLFRPARPGLTVPLSRWLAVELNQLKNDMLNETAIKRTGILNPKYVRKIMSGFDVQPQLYVEKLWLILVFEMWMRKWKGV